jgi:hypothetical protein
MVEALCRKNEPFTHFQTGASSSEQNSVRPVRNQFTPRLSQITRKDSPYSRKTLLELQRYPRVTDGGDACRFPNNQSQFQVKKEIRKQQFIQIDEAKRERLWHGLGSLEQGLV